MTLGQTQTVAQPFTYVGQYGVMAESYGYYYMRARYYDPGSGRFVSEGLVAGMLTCMPM